MRILFVPDGLWGELSGHRSAKYLIKAFNLINVSIAVYASKKDYTDLQHKEIRKNNCLYFPKSNYDYTQQFFRKNTYREFEDIVKEYKPDLVFYLGTIKNKISIDYCIKHNIKAEAHDVLGSENEIDTILDLQERMYKCEILQTWRFF